MTEWWILLLFYTVWWIFSCITILYVLTTHIVVGLLCHADAGCTENRQLYSCVVTVDAAAWWDWRPWPGKHRCLPSAPILCVCVCVCVRVLEHVKTPCVLSPLESHGTGKIIITYKKWNLLIKFVLYYFSPLCSHQGNLFSTWPWWTFVHLMDFKRVFVILKTV